MRSRGAHQCVVDGPSRDVENGQPGQEVGRGLLVEEPGGGEVAGEKSLKGAAVSRSAADPARDGIRQR